MKKAYMPIKEYQYMVTEHGVIDAIRIYNTPDGVKARADIKTAFHYTFTIDWLDGENRNSLLSYGANGYTYIYDEREMKPKWEDI